MSPLRCCRRTHGRGPQAAAILESLSSALRTIDPDSAAVLVQFVDSCLADPQAKQMWRESMTAIQYFWRHPLAEQVRRVAGYRLSTGTQGLLVLGTDEPRTPGT